MKLLITGASGFLGRALVAESIHRGLYVRAALRAKQCFQNDVHVSVVGEINADTDWTNALQDIDVVIHLAARVHVMQETAVDPLAEFRKVNLHGTENLANQAASAGVKRLIYVSSIKVNGENTILPFTELDKPNPVGPYAVSKFEAESALHRISADKGLEIVILRPPLIYGRDVKGNFAQMLKVLSIGLPLPFASIKNLRSLIFVGNFVDALLLCSEHSAAAGQTYLVSDLEDVSTPNLLRGLAHARERRANLLSCPPKFLRFFGKIFGKSEQIERLLDSLRIDATKIRRELNWIPPFSLQQGLRETAGYQA